MMDVMQLMETRLRELYDFDSAKTKCIGSTTFYFFENDERSIIFLNEFFTLDYRKLDQIKNLNNLIMHIRNRDIDKSVSCIVAIDAGTLKFNCNIKFHINRGQKIENAKIGIHETFFSFNSFIDNSAYEEYYQKKLEELNSLLPSDITLAEFNFKNKSSPKDIINASITDNAFVYVDNEEFIEKYSNVSDDYDDSNMATAIRKFGLKPAEIRQALKPFFPADKLNHIVFVLSHFAFFSLIDNPSGKFEELQGYIGPLNGINKFSRHHDCYFMGIDMPETMHFSNIMKYRSIGITTDDYFISYNTNHRDRINIATQSYEVTKIKGIDAVYNELKKDIANVFKENLDIEQQDISNQDIELITMISF